MFPASIYIRVYQYPAPDELNPELRLLILNLLLPVRSYLLVGTLEPYRAGDETVYLIDNDDLFMALSTRHPNRIEELRPLIPIGQVTKVPISCCEVYRPTEDHS